MSKKSDLRASREERQAVWEIIKSHKGRAHCVTNAEIGAMLDLPKRKVRAIVSHLRNEGFLIGVNVVGKGGGYYLIETAAEFESSRGSLRAMATKLWMVDHAMCRAWKRAMGGVPQPLLPNWPETLEQEG